MARAKQYTYQIKGNKLSLLEVDINASGDGLNYAYDDGTLTGTTSPFGTSGHALDLGGGSSLLTSPISSVTDGLEIEYAYSPEYRINQIATTVACDRYTNSNGLLKIVDAGNGLPTSGVTHIVIGGSERWNGSHKVNTLNAGYTILETKYNGGSVTEAFTVYTDIDVLNDESDVIDVPPYLAKALVYYVKGKVAEDIMEMELVEYWMIRFRRMLEKHENSKVWGPRMVSSGINAIR